jgi:hypothetical protein
MIAADLGLTAEGVRKIISRLVKKGWLVVERPDHTAPGRGLQYHVTRPDNHPNGCRGEHPNGCRGVSANHPNGQAEITPTAKPRKNAGIRMQNTSKNTVIPTYDWNTYTFVGVQEDLLHQWSQAYPLVDVQAEIRKAAAWCRNNESKARARKDWPRFLGNWLAKDQRDASASGRTKREPQPGDPDWLPTEEYVDKILAKVRPA